MIRADTSVSYSSEFRKAARCILHLSLGNGSTKIKNINRSKSVWYHQVGGLGKSEIYCEYYVGSNAPNMLEISQPPVRPSEYWYHTFFLGWPI